MMYIAEISQNENPDRDCLLILQLTHSYRFLIYLEKDNHKQKYGLESKLILKSRVLFILNTTVCVSRPQVSPPAKSVAWETFPSHRRRKQESFHHR